MKLKSSIAILAFIGLLACDKIDRPYIPAEKAALDQSLYPGSWSDYPWPTFTANTNTNRNVLIEDYTGHTCVYCPAAATVAAQIETDNPNRVFVASIHAGPSSTGIVGFQELDPPTFIEDFTTPEGKAYGAFFMSGYGFDANPRGTISRKKINNLIFQVATSWTDLTNTLLTENELKVNLQAKINYFDETRGLFLHTEIEKLAPIGSDLGIVSYLIEESFISPQKKAGSGTILDYHHHNVHRGNIDGLAWGRTVLESDLDSDKKYLDYSFKLPTKFDPSNCHVLVYAYDKTTLEVYQVIKVEIQP